MRGPIGAGALLAIISISGSVMAQMGNSPISFAAGSSGSGALRPGHGSAAAGMSDLYRDVIVRRNQGVRRDAADPPVLYLKRRDRIVGWNGAGPLEKVAVPIDQWIAQLDSISPVDPADRQ